MNNKMIKGSVAGATGIVLLMGGFGTYALWSDSVTTPGGSVTSGVLDITAGSVVWDNAKTATAEDWGSTDLMVPGDKITRTQEFTLTGTGKRLEGTVDLSIPVGATLLTETGSSADQAAMVTTFVVTAADGSPADTFVVQENADTTDNPYDFVFSGPIGTDKLTAVATFELPSTVTNQVAQNMTAAISDTTITISQTDPNS